MSNLFSYKSHVKQSVVTERGEISTEESADPYPPPLEDSFLHSDKPNFFRQKFFPAISPETWNDWYWQLENRFTSYKQLKRVLDLTENEITALTNSNPLPIAITPYYLSLIDRNNPSDPLRRCMIPTCQEWVKSDGEDQDPLGEDHQSPVEGLVHRYPDRVLFLVTSYCSANCRYCTRSRVVGRRSLPVSKNRWDKALRYIAQHKEIRDVLISGGDPLTLSGEQLEMILTPLRAMEHIQIIRIGTKVPIVLPQRITKDIAGVLKKFHPLFISVHVTHPSELTPEAVKALGTLVDAGIPLGSQTVLLKGVNDDAGIMKDLMHRILMARVRPYYLYQCDPIIGSSHFRTTVDKGVEIIKSLRGWTSGYAIPTYVIDAPGGGGKIPISPDYTLGNNGKGLLLENYEGKQYVYPSGEVN
jgi:lysine 2,3-aminomutase